MFPSRRLALLPLIVLAIYVGSSDVTDAQSGSRLDHRGTEFRIAFLPTEGDGEYSTYYISVSCDRPTTGSLTYEASGRTIPISIPEAHRPVRVTLDTFSLLLPDPKRQGEISRQTATLRFNAEVTLHAINTLRWSSDAFLALPNDVLGMKYVIMSYPNTIEPGAAGQVLDVADFPSQFAVVATEDNTRVTIQPTVSVNGRGRTNPIGVTLNRGQVFLGQAIDQSDKALVAGHDLTGTVVESDKPVVVYGSHERTNIPWDSAFGRDHLVEQLVPVDRWTSEVIAVPQKRPSQTVPAVDFIRVLSLKPNTKLAIRGLPEITLSAIAPTEIPLERPLHLIASGPIQVAQYQHSSFAEPKRTLDTIGDPFMMLVYGQEQFDSEYSINSWETKDFLLHYVNVVIPTGSESTLRIDDAVADAIFESVEGSGYSYAQIGLPPGGHHITADVPFGLYAYGYGPFNSYAYPGGMFFEQLSNVSENHEGESRGLSVGPNPTSGDLLIRREEEGGLIHGVDVFDMLGRRLLSVDERGHTIRLNIAGLPSGIYVVNVNTESGMVQRRVVLE